MSSKNLLKTLVNQLINEDVDAAKGTFSSFLKEATGTKMKTGKSVTFSTGSTRSSDERNIKAAFPRDLYFYDKPVLEVLKNYIKSVGRSIEHVIEDVIGPDDIVQNHQCNFVGYSPENNTFVFGIDVEVTDKNAKNMYLVPMITAVEVSSRPRATESYFVESYFVGEFFTHDKDGSGGWKDNSKSAVKVIEQLMGDSYDDLITIATDNANEFLGD